MLTNGGDLDIYRHGGLQVLHGDPLYAEPIPPRVGGSPTPFAAVGFIPLAFLAFPAAQVVWMLTSFVALTATIWRCATVLGYRTNWQLGSFSAAMAFVAVDVEAVRGTLWQGQVNLVLMAIIVWDLTRPREARLRGLGRGSRGRNQADGNRIRPLPAGHSAMACRGYCDGDGCDHGAVHMVSAPPVTRPNTGFTRCSIPIGSVR